MGRPVYVWPVDLLRSVYCDVHGGNRIEDHYQMFHASVGPAGNREVEVSIIFEVDTPLVPAGHLSIFVVGRRSRDGAEAERAAVMTMVEALRTQHNLCRADYNFVRLSERRALFNATRAAALTFRSAYNDLESIMKNMKAGMSELCAGLTSWIFLNQPATDEQASIAVNGLLYSMRRQSVEVAKELEHYSQLISLLSLRDVEPEDQQRFDETCPMPMVVQWERSLFVLGNIYLKAIKHFRCSVQEVKFTRTRHGQINAFVELDAEPYKFVGESAGDRRAAKAKLFYAVIKHVEDELGHPIFDFHYVVRKYQESFIDRFDNNMSNIWAAAMKLRQSFEATCNMFAECADDFFAEVGGNASTWAACTTVKRFDSFLMASKGSFAAGWAAMTEAKVSRDIIEVNLGV